MSDVPAIGAPGVSPNAKADAAFKARLENLRQADSKAKELSEAARKKPEAVQRFDDLRRAKAREEIGLIKKQLDELRDFAFLDPQALGGIVKFMSRRLAAASKEYVAAGPSGDPSARANDEKFVKDVKDLHTRLKVMHEVQMRKARAAGASQREIEKDAEDFEKASLEIDAASEEILSWHGIDAVSAREPAHIPATGENLEARGKREPEDDRKDKPDEARADARPPVPVPANRADDPAHPTRPAHPEHPAHPPHPEQGGGADRPGGAPGADDGNNPKAKAWRKVDLLKQEAHALGKEDGDPAAIARKAVGIARDLAAAAKQHVLRPGESGKDNNDVKDRDGAIAVDARFVGEVRSLYGRLHALAGADSPASDAVAAQAAAEMREAGRAIDRAFADEAGGGVPPGAAMDILA